MTTTHGRASRTARDIARKQLTGAILGSARTQLAVVGPAQLSVRAVARDVGMVSSAVYRYFPSRDDLLTALLIICYDELGAAVETAEAVVPREDLLDRWLAIAHAVRAWGRAHREDFGLLYGSPVPGYAAPTSTVAPASRVPRLLMALLRDRHLAGQTTDALPGPRPDLHTALAGLREFAEADLPDAVLIEGLGAWSGLVGALVLELFGHLTGAVDDLDTFFAAVARRLAPLGGPGPG